MIFYSPNEQLWSVHLSLNELYGTQEIYGRSDPMHELIATILSHRTTHANEVAAFRAMQARFPTCDTQRVGVLDPKVSAERAHKILLEELPKDRWCCSPFTNISIGTVSGFAHGITQNVTNVCCLPNALVSSRAERWS